MKTILKKLFASVTQKVSKDKAEVNYTGKSAKIAQAFNRLPRGLFLKNPTPHCKPPVCVASSLGNHQ